RFGGRQGNGGYQYTLEADDLTTLRTWATNLANELKKDPNLTDVNTDQQEHGLQAFITVDHDSAARLGLTSAAVDNVLYDSFGQRQVSTIYNALNQYHVIMEVPQADAEDPTALASVYLSTGTAATTASARGQPTVQVNTLALSPSAI